MSTTIHSSKIESLETVSSPIARYIQAAILSLLAAWAFWPNLLGMYASWFDEKAYMDHGILVIPAAAYMVWTKWDRIKQVPLAPSRWGVLLVLVGAMCSTFGIAAHWVFLGRLAFLFSLVGLIMALCGLRMVRELMYPLMTLIFMVAPPTFVYERLTLSLQLLASQFGEISLEALGYSVVREGNVLELVGTKLSVEEACSGLRSLLSITFMCNIYNYFFVAGNPLRLFILVMAVPIAVLGNVCRIVATGIASQYNKELIHGTAHDAFGYVSIMIAAGGCVLLHLVVLRIQKRWRAHHA